MSYHTNIVYDTTENRNFRTVLYTGKKSQLVVMNIPPKGEIGTETHPHVEQTIFVLQGSASVTLDGTVSQLEEGDAIVVTPGTQHNVVNTGSGDLKLYTVYTPPNHLDGRVHGTKADADRDEEDEAYGNTIAFGLRSNGKAHAASGFFPDIEPRPEPSSPLENPENPAISIHDNFLLTKSGDHIPLARTSEVEL